MSAMEVIKKGFDAANKNLGLVAILFVFYLVGEFVGIKFAVTDEMPALTQLRELILVVILAMAGIFVQAGNLGVIRDYFTEGKMHLVSFVKYGLKYFLPLLGLGLALIGVSALLLIIGGFIIVPIGLSTAVIIASIIFLVLEGIGLYWVLLLAALSPYGIVCGELPVIQAMAASVDITRRFINKVALLFLIIGLISLAWSAIIHLIPDKNQMLIALISAAFSGYFGVLIPASVMALYLSLTTE
ncbi:MAG: hypothetical protein KKD29_03645 [Candidatus Omnitrophica bacterium]|nr:hypothetical protein [Candidatus Omnitrophota bacterium]